jgi:hypothetical protein
MLEALGREPYGGIYISGVESSDFPAIIEKYR